MEVRSIEKDITFVVQGGISSFYTPHLLLSIRKYFPSSRILLSTWEGSDLAGLEFDDHILSEDPGDQGIMLFNSEVKNNCNRQMLSSIKGIQKCDTDYVVKVRSDMIFLGNGLKNSIASAMDIPSDIASNSRLFSGRVIVIGDHSINPSRCYSLLYHPCDYLYAGQTSDLKLLFSGALMSSEDASFFDCHYSESGAAPAIRARFSNEQYILVSMLKKLFGSYPIDHCYDNTLEKEKAFFDFLRENFYLVTSKSLQLSHQKYDAKTYQKAHSFSSHECESFNSMTMNSFNHGSAFDLERTIKILLSNLKKLKSFSSGR